MQEGHHQTEGPCNDHMDRQPAPQAAHLLTNWEKQPVLIVKAAARHSQQHSWGYRLIQRFCMLQWPLGRLVDHAYATDTTMLRTNGRKDRLQWTGSLKPRLSTL